MKILAVLTLSVFLAACSTNQSANNEILMAQIEQPTFRMECPETGCNFSSFEYNDPNRQISTPTNGYDVANKSIGALSSVLLGVAPYFAIAEGFKYMNGDTTTSTTTDSSDRSIREDNSIIDDNRTVDRSIREDNSIVETVPPLISSPE